MTPILIDLETLVRFYHITRRNEQAGGHNAPKDYRKWTDPGKEIEIKGNC
jgi:hypothetical protein